MADTWFSAKEWKARLVEFAGRRSLRNVANGETATYDVSRSEGQVSQEGDAFNTKNMNDLEQRISNGFANAKTNIDALNRDLHALNDSGAIKGLDAREDGVYITYVPTSGADTVTKKLGDIASAIKTGSYNYTHSKKGGFPKTLTHDTGKGNKLIAASVTSISNLNFYKWQQNYNAYAPGGVLCTCDNGIVTVTFQGTPTNETETGANDYRTATIGVTYWYYED